MSLVAMRDLRGKQWHGCYDDSWKGIIVPQAFCHPAKMARGLLTRILDHAVEQGWIRKGSTVLDPFGGIGSTGIKGAYRGLRVICVELEPRFVALAQQNFELHRSKWELLGCPQPVMLQGDSRKLLEIVEGAECVVGSPPYAESLSSKQHGIIDIRRNKSNSDIQGAYYGSSPGQLGVMPPGSVEAVVGSPPYVGGGSSGNQVGSWKISHPGYGAPLKEFAGYGKSIGQLAQLPAGEVELVLSSPPYEGTPVEQTHMTSSKRGDPQHPHYRPSWKKKLSEGYAKTKRPYGMTPSQLSQMKPGKVMAVVSSPPYENSPVNPGDVGGETTKRWRTGKSLSNHELDCYGKHQQQIGNSCGDNFWSATKIILQQCHALLAPSGHAIWVVKDFVRAKKRVPFAEDWKRLCEAVGFQLVCEHHAMLTKTWEEETLFEGTVKREKARKSFFRRLCESKGSPKIDWETVLCFERGK